MIKTILISSGTINQQSLLTAGEITVTILERVGSARNQPAACAAAVSPFL